MEAYQYTLESDVVLNGWMDKHKLDYHYNRDGQLCIPTLEGEMRANIGSWIVRGHKGEFWPVKQDIFEETYEEVEAPNDN